MKIIIKFGGKEYQDELGLDWYDITARNYDPALGRWMNVDPLSADYYEYSTYNYTLNNPVVYVDPDGKGVLDWEDNDGNLIYDTTKNDGKGGFTEHATQEQKDLAKDLRSTKTGEEQFQKLVNSEEKVVIDVNKTEVGKSSDGTLAGGKTVNSKNSKGEDIVRITVYEQSAEKIESAINNQIDKGFGVAFDGANVITEKVESGTFLIIAVGHEIEHTTVKNRKLQMKAGKTPSVKQRKKIEKKPTKVENKIINERTN